MCGIAGVIDFRGRPIAEDQLAAARDALAHRGPDDHGIWRFRSEGFSAAMVHTRLAVIDPSPAGRQPFADRTDRYHLTYNGEIYNFREIRDSLCDRYPFATQCDTEALLAMLIHHGINGLRSLNGMWAFGFLDTHERCGWLARDRFGIKPLYYTREPAGRLIFASEMRALLALWDSTTSLTIDPTAIELYLSLGFVPHPLTIYREIAKLPPGHVLRFDPAGAHSPDRYYTLPQPDPVPAYEDAVSEVRRRIDAAVRARTVSDVPLGAFLSGGVDSSAIVAALASSGASTVKTFSIGYADHAVYDETAYARQVAQRLGTDHHAFFLTTADILDALPDLLNHMAEPFADASLIPTSIVSRLTRQHVTVALSGDGGDELFAGYWRYLGHAYLRRYRRLPGWLRRGVVEPLLAAAPSAKTSRWMDRVRQARKLLRGDLTDPMARHAAWSRLAEPDVVTALLQRDRPDDLTSRLRSAGEDLAPGRSYADELSPLLCADLAFSLPADMLYKVDIASMRHGLEVRVPFLDPQVVGFVAGLPIAFKMSGRHRKRLLADAYRDVLPPAILTRRKMGFEVPIGELFRGPLGQAYRDVVTTDRLQDLGLCPRAAVDVFREHEARRQERADLLYALFALCWWLHNVPRPHRPIGIPSR